MSIHKVPLTPTEEAGLRAHGLQRNIGKPSQLADVFRQGVAWGIAAERDRWIAKAGATYTDAHAIFNDPPSETPQEVRDVIEWHLHAMRANEGPNARANLTDTAR